MTRICARCFRVTAWLVVLVLVVVVPPAQSKEVEWLVREFDSLPATPATPEGPPAVELMIDDGSAEGAFGVTGAAARQFMWFNQFTPTVAAPFFLDEIWVLFPPDQILVPGSEIELVVYLDEDGDPTNGATLLASIPEVVQATDGSSFSIYPVVPGIEIGAPGDVLIGVIARYIETGVTPPTAPAALDLSSSEGRSWLAIWTGDPPVAPDLPPDDVLDLIDIFEPSNFMIRGFGSLPVPAMPVAWLAMLAIFLAAGGFLLIRRG